MKSALQFVLQLIGMWVVVGFLVRAGLIVAESHFPTLKGYLNRPATWRWRLKVVALGLVITAPILWFIMR
jgi:hypothetical protein